MRTKDCKKTATLCIIDMQPLFEEAAQNIITIQSIIKLIREAKRNKAGIVVLEYKNFGSTHGEIKRAIGKYKKAVYVTKDNDDGSKELLSVVFNRSFNKTYFKICGVNIDACVNATVRGIFKNHLRAKIEVVARACDSDILNYKGFNHKGLIEQYFKDNRQLKINWK